ncbi:DUF928 domain-containing protein [Laspinema olomoucense]|uniref:DUF928 domain-containing protein n=1 Tax=Laspinema olomoucense TaxID=3231600 RepID=UPI0021BB7B9B|nr:MULTISPECIES: DUF928 domain-containing protein [unclassified Laspinema]MCT7971299.1 DUF928 domain-containing protein [Laspinema sp. D3d]MCT7987653.1 DUF928 domain-containing protein [Laspinema sp. D3a]
MPGQKTPLSLIPVGFAVLVAIAIVSRLSTPLQASATAREIAPATPGGELLTQGDPLDPPTDQPSPLQGSAGGTRFYQPPLLEPPSPGLPINNGIRGKCPVDLDLPSESLTALMPSSGVGLTLAGNSTSFLIYLPSTSALTGEFILQDETGTEQLYQMMVTLTNTPGIIKLTVPLDELSLKSGEYYRWYFSILCDPTDRAADLFVSGWLKPMDVSPSLMADLDNAATPLERAEIYGKNGFWYPTLELLADIQQSSTDFSTEAKIGWDELLSSEVVNLESLVNQPFLECCEMENQPLPAQP